ncbi:MAG TPA: hypothetical protein VM327_09470 [Candidatus Thermoplasmatota archaeon]|nr:hypothetical protein [Candidatus Thermoplasmatota archaeon]
MEVELEAVEDEEGPELVAADEEELELDVNKGGSNPVDEELACVVLLPDVVADVLEDDDGDEDWGKDWEDPSDGVGEPCDPSAAGRPVDDEGTLGGGPGIPAASVARTLAPVVSEPAPNGPPTRSPPSEPSRACPEVRGPAEATRRANPATIPRRAAMPAAAMAPAGGR